MTKTVCDICGKEMPTEKIKSIENFNFCISSYGRAWDVCNECREELNRWITTRKAENIKEKEQ